MTPTLCARIEEAAHAVQHRADALAALLESQGGAPLEAVLQVAHARNEARRLLFVARALASGGGDGALEQPLGSVLAQLTRSAERLQAAWCELSGAPAPQPASSPERSSPAQPPRAKVAGPRLRLIRGEGRRSELA